MYDDEFELTFNLQDDDTPPVELPKAEAEEAAPEAPAEAPKRKPPNRNLRCRKHPQSPKCSRRHRPGLLMGAVC